MHDIKHIEDIKVKEAGKREWYSFIVNEIDGVLYCGMVDISGKFTLFKTRDEYERVKQDVISSTKNSEICTVMKDDKCMISDEDALNLFY